MPVACDKVVIMRQKQGGRKDDRMTVFHLTIFWSSVHHFYSIFASNSSSVNLRYKQAMSSDNAAKEHKVCLTWNGRHEIVALTPNMTMIYNKEAASSQPFVPHPQHLFHAGAITDKDD
jgi:hypothetical protein